MTAAGNTEEALSIVEALARACRLAEVRERLERFALAYPSNPRLKELRRALAAR